MNKIKSEQILLTLLMFLVCSISSISQNQVLGISASIGLSKIPLTSPNFNDNSAKFTLSGNAGVFLEKSISSKSSIGLEALLIRIEGKDLTDNTIITDNNGQVIGEVSSQSKLHSNYVGLPLYYRFETGKIGIKAGFQPMVFLFANSTFKASGEIGNEPYEEINKAKNLKFKSIDFGPKIGIDYRLNETLRFRADFYHGLIDISEESSFIKRKIRQINFGIQYLFRRNNSDK